MNLRKLVTILASFLITSVFLALALYRVDFTQFVRAFAAADYRLLVFAVLATFCGYVLRAARWQRFLNPIKKIPLPRLFPILVVGFALNNLLPGRPGEFARPYWLGKREGLSKTLGFATVIVERVADGVALIAFLLIALAAFKPLGMALPPTAETIAVLATILFGVALAGLIFLLVREKLALRIFQLFTRFLPHRFGARLEKMLGSFVTGLHSLKSPRDILAIALLSLATWACEATAYFFVLSAFGTLPRALDHAVAAAFMMVLINLGVMIPAAPGGVGPFEAAAIFALSVFGVNDSLAASVALGAHALQYGLVTGLGLIFISREGINIAQATTDTAEPE